MIKKILPVLLIYLAVLVLFQPVFRNYFSQDDFFEFKLSQTNGSVGQFISLFGFYSYEKRGVAFYRPLFREALHNLFYQWFGLNPFPFSILSMLLHFLNIALLYIFLQKLFHNKLLSFLSTLFFAISTANVAILYYFAGGTEIQGATAFALLCLIFYLDFLQNGRLGNWLISFLAYLLALGSHEVLALTPILLLILGWVFKKPVRALKMFLPLIPFYLVLAACLYLNVFIIGYSSTEKQYQTTFSIKTTLNTVVWYSGWALGLPEMLIDFVNPGFKLNPILMQYWGDYYRLIFPYFFGSALLILAALIHLLLKGVLFNDKKPIFLLAWFLISILPVVFLPQHKSSHYLAPALAGFWALLFYVILKSHLILKQIHPTLSFFGLTISLLALAGLSLVSIKLESDNYWAISRGQIAEHLINEVKNKYPTLPKGAIVYFTNDPNYPYFSSEWGKTSKQAKFALNGDLALQLLYHDPTIKVYYEDLGKPPKEQQVYSIVARY